MPSYRIALVLLATSLLSAGCGPSSPEENRSAENAVRDADRIRFTEVTDAAGLDRFRYENGAYGEKWLPETMGGGGAFLDYDGDGHLDVLLVGGRRWPHRGPPGPALELYRNEGDGTFRRVTDSAGLSDVHAYGFGLAAADYDGDGDPDVYLTALRENLLLENEEGTFRDVTKRAGVAGEGRWSTAALFFDADRDGHPDLFVGNYVEWSRETDVRCTVADTLDTYCAPEVYEGVDGVYFHNRGDGTFEDRTAEAGFLPMPGKTLGVTELDVDGDGWSDLVVANDLERNLLYRNDGDGTFTEIGRRSGIALSARGEARGSMGIDAGRVAPGQPPTVFVGNFSQEMIGAFRLQPDLLFEDRAAVSRIGEPSLPILTFGLFLFDPDLDGDLDLFAANGHIRVRVGVQRQGTSYRQPPQVYAHERDGRFRLQRGISAFSDSLVGRGAAYGDYDGDGDQDVLVVENTGPVHLWRNETGGPRLRIRLLGAGPDPGGARFASTREALGAEAHLRVGDSTFVRRVRTGSSYLAQNELALTFGLGTRARADSLRIRWPSGRSDTFAGPFEAGTELTVKEGAGIVGRRTLPEPSP